jgi:arsenate reductase
MKKVYYLSTCDTCARIMSQVPQIEEWDKVDIKSENISAEDLDLIAKESGGYEAVFSKRARKFRGEGWNEKELSEQDYRGLILKEYTFLKRPVFLIDDHVFVGNSKKTVSALLEYIQI